MADDELSLRAAGEKLWIVKVPRFLMENLEAASVADSRASLGTVRQDEESLAGTSSSGAGKSFTLTLPDSMDPKLPREYELRFGAPPPATYILSRGADGGQATALPAHEGRVEARGDLKPKGMDEKYRQLIKDRREVFEAPKRQLEALPDDKDIKRTALNTMKMREAEKGARDAKIERRMNNAHKRTKPQLSHGQMKEKLKELFATQTHWRRTDLAGLLGHNNQGVLGACLDELCDKVTQKGAHYGDHKLKAYMSSGLTSKPGASGVKKPQ